MFSKKNKLKNKFPEGALWFSIVLKKDFGSMSKRLIHDKMNSEPTGLIL